MKYIKITKNKGACILTISNGPFNTLSTDVLKELDLSGNNLKILPNDIN